MQVPAFNSSAVGTCKQLSHWSPFVSCPHSGQVSNISLSAKNLLQCSQKACFSIFSYIYPLS